MRPNVVCCKGSYCLSSTLYSRKPPQDDTSSGELARPRPVHMHVHNSNIEVGPSVARRASCEVFLIWLVHGQTIKHPGPDLRVLAVRMDTRKSIGTTNQSCCQQQGLTSPSDLNTHDLRLIMMVMHVLLSLDVRQLPPSPPRRPHQ